jgi:hypothetical protein
MAKPKLYDPDAERALVGAALTDPGLFASKMDPEDFYLEDMAAIWRAGQAQYSAGTLPDLITLADELGRSGAGITFDALYVLAAKTVAIANAEAWAATIRDYAERRRLSATLGRVMHQVQMGNDLETLHTALIAEMTRRQKALKAERATSKTSWTVAELYEAVFPEPTWAVPGVIPTGLTFLAGRPKVGKSWLALQIAHAKGTGGQVLDRSVAQGPVLYLALEDSARRLRARLQRQRAPQSAEITFETTWRRFTEGGLDDLRVAVEDAHYSLIVVDTFARAVGAADQLDHSDMTALTGRLQELALAHEIAILLVDHHRKSMGNDTDPIDDLLGSTAKSAVADGALGLSREHGNRGATLKITGRDVEAQELTLSWDAITCCWQYGGTADEAAVHGNKSKVLNVLRDLCPETATLSELASATGIGANNLHPLLVELEREGYIERLPKRKREVPYRLRKPEA